MSRYFEITRRSRATTSEQNLWPGSMNTSDGCWTFHVWRMSGRVVLLARGSGQDIRSECFRIPTNWNTEGMAHGSRCFVMYTAVGMLRARGLEHGRLQAFGRIPLARINTERGGSTGPVSVHYKKEERPRIFHRLTPGLNNWFACEARCVFTLNKSTRPINNAFDVLCKLRYGLATLRARQ